MDFTDVTSLRPLLGAVAFLLGAVIGSFLNVVCLRLPKIMERDWKAQCCELLNIEQPLESPPFNLAFPPSHCPQCKHTIRWWENIPILSYLILKGQCSNCKSAISKRYPIIELTSAILSFCVVWYYGFSIQALMGLFLSWTLIGLAVIDFDTQLLPDDITLPLIWAGLSINLFNVFTPLENAVVGAIIGYLLLWSVYWLFKLLTGKEGMGFGDFKLLAALGAWFGWQALPFIILCSSCVGTLVGITLIVANKQGRSTAIPFGPYLAIAGWINLIWGTQINDWYLTTTLFY